MGEGLKLRAQDAEDLRALSAHLQDAIVPVRDMAFLPEQRRFVLVANRFCWEKGADRIEEEPATQDSRGRDAPFEGGGAVFGRVHSGICFDGVLAVRCKGIDLRARDVFLNLLAVFAEGSRILLQFSGGAAIELTADGLRCHMQDLGECWPTRWQPHHPLDGADARPA